MYKICLIFVGLFFFKLMNTIFIYPPTDGYMKKASKISPPTLSPRATKAADATLSGTIRVQSLSIGSARGRSRGPGIVHDRTAAHGEHLRLTQRCDCIWSITLVSRTGNFLFSDVDNLLI